MDIVKYVKNWWKGVEYSIPQNVSDIDKLTDEELVNYSNIIFISKFEDMVTFWRRTGIMKAKNLQDVMRYMTEDEFLSILSHVDTTFIHHGILTRSIELGWNRVMMHIIDNTNITYILRKRYYYYVSMFYPMSHKIQLEDENYTPPKGINKQNVVITEGITVDHYRKLLTNNINGDKHNYRTISYVHHILYLIITNAIRLRPKCKRYRMRVNVLDWLAHEYPTSVQELYDRGDEGIKFICIKYLSSYINSSIVVDHWRYYTRILINRTSMCDVDIITTS